LVADAGVGALVSDRIYDNVPNGVTFPYVSFGPTQEITDDEQCIDGEEHVFQIDVWDRSQARLSPTKRIAGAVKAALHDAALTLPDPYALAFIRVTSTRTMRDPDGITGHGIVIVEARVEL
ncbi:DUF3168 domain-containing protein, partial [Roseivivax isoporae]